MITSNLFVCPSNSSGANMAAAVRRRCESAQRIDPHRNQLIQCPIAPIGVETPRRITRSALSSTPEAIHVLLIHVRYRGRILEKYAINLAVL
jgi:hypothetical protein